MTSSPPHSPGLPWLLPGAVFLFVLPLSHTIGWRWPAAAIALAIALWQWRRSGALPPLPCTRVIALWLGTLLLTLVWARNPSASLSELKVDVVYSLLMYAAFYMLTADARALRFWLVVLCAGSSLASLIAIFAFFHFDQRVDDFVNVSTAGGFATYLITALPAISLLLVPGMPWSGRGYAVRFALPLILLGGVLSLSRMFIGALMLMTVAATLLWAVSRNPDSRRLIRISVGVGLAVAAAAVITLIFADQRDLMFSADLRPAIWKLALQQIAQHPWTGSGYGRLIDRDIYEQAFPGITIWHPHNLFLGFAEETGIFGAITIGLVFLAFAREYWRLYRSATRALSWIGIAGLAMLLGVLAKNMTDMFFVRESAILFWSINGMLLGFARRAPGLAVAPAARADG